MSTMSLNPVYQDLLQGVTCIDTNYRRPQLAACYLMVQGDQAAIIDTGTYHSVPLILEVLHRKGIAREQVAYVMPTHVHLDHAGGAGELIRQLPNAKLVIHPRGARHMIDPEKLTLGSIAVYGKGEFQQQFGELLPVPEDRVIIADDEFSLDLNGRTLLFLDTPGHAKHHYSVYDEYSNGFFTGDTFGLSYRELDGQNGAFIFPPTTPVHFNPTAWHDSIARYLRLKPQRMFLTHYGMVTEVGRLADDLCRSIDKLATIAQEAADSPDRHHLILQNVTDFLLDEAKESHPEHSAQYVQEVFALDLELNTQGLEIWLDRQAKMRE